MATDEKDDGKLRIGITCYPTFGGSGIVATELGMALAHRGHRVHFISYDVPGRLSTRLSQFADNVFFHEVEVSDYPLFQHNSYPLALASKMVEVATWEKLDLLHVHYAMPHAASAYLARQILGARAPKIITTLHGTDITLVGADPSYLPITRFSILASDGVTVPSRYLEHATHELLDVPLDTPIEVIPNFVDTDAYCPAEAAPAGRGSALHRLFPRVDWSRRPGVLIHNSNFRPLKRVDDVVRVLAEVRRSAPALLVLVGDGPERSRVEALVHELDLVESVCFLGKQLEFAAVLRECDLFLLPSVTESFGLAALEALSCGVPVVASRVGGLPEVVDDGVTGLLVKSGDVAEMARAVVALLGDEARRKNMARAARADVERRFRREPLVERYEAYYEEVLGRSARTTSSTPRSPS